VMDIVDRGIGTRSLLNAYPRTMKRSNDYFRLDGARNEAMDMRMKQEE
jgi:hypothetical protein